MVISKPNYTVYSYFGYNNAMKSKIVLGIFGMAKESKVNELRASNRVKSEWIGPNGSDGMLFNIFFCLSFLNGRRMFFGSLRLACQMTDEAK